MSFDGFNQNAYVTRNLDKAVAMFKERHGHENFVYFEPDMDVWTAYAGTGRAVVKVASFWVNDVMIELIEPVSGMVQHYTDYLPDDDSLRFHHIGMVWDDWDAARADADRKGWKPYYEGSIEGVKWVYYDARDTLGHYLEYYWATPEMWKAIRGK